MVLILVVITAGIAAAGKFVQNPGSAPLPPPIKRGPELVMVFIGSSNCAGIKDPRLSAAIKQLRTLYQSEAEATGAAFVGIGISLDWVIKDGSDILETFGPFDEVLIGRSWLNTGALKYIWDDMPGAPSIPQLILMKEKSQAMATCTSKMSASV